MSESSGFVQEFLLKITLTNSSEGIAAFGESMAITEIVIFTFVATRRLRSISALTPALAN